MQQAQERQCMSRSAVVYDAAHNLHLWRFLLPGRPLVCTHNSAHNSHLSRFSHSKGPLRVHNTPPVKLQISEQILGHTFTFCKNLHIVMFIFVYNVAMIRFANPKGCISTMIGWLRDELMWRTIVNFGSICLFIKKPSPSLFSCASASSSHHYYEGRSTNCKRHALV